MLLLSAGQGVLAQSVSTAYELTSSVGNNNASIVMEADIELSSYLNINGKTLTIDLNGHKLYRNITGNYTSVPSFNLPIPSNRTEGSC
jgi:hypothetical protein